MSEGAALGRMLEAARRVVVFTGAGISTESGIPDFRSPGGLWSRHQPIPFDEFMASAAARREAWRRKFAIDSVLAAAVPNRGHRAVAALITRGRAGSVITQNIDALHQAAGVPAEKVIELHGNGTYAKCLDCGERYELAPLRDAFEREGMVPDCRECGGIVKSATISFGQAMPLDAMRRAELATAAADLFLAVGSSLVVQPAAGFPVQAKRAGAALVILNREPTPLDGIADLVLRADIGPTLGEAVGVD